MKLAHTLDDALERFELVKGAGDGDRTACAMSAARWICGEDGWSDELPCVHPLIRSLLITANDENAATPQSRKELLSVLVADGLDTWWVPLNVVLVAISRVDRSVGPQGTAVTVMQAVAAWKASGDKENPELRSADLSSADLSWADLSSANLSSANLRSANLSSANLRLANLRSADLRSADLSWANLSSANLRSANLRSADLSWANLSSANLRSANLSSANLSSADLYSANLRLADLSSADLRLANLRSADLRWTKNLSSAINIDKARADAYTHLPEGWTVENGLIVRAS